MFFFIIENIIFSHSTHPDHIFSSLYSSSTLSSTPLSSSSTPLLSSFRKEQDIKRQQPSMTKQNIIRQSNQPDRRKRVPRADKELKTYPLTPTVANLANHQANSITRYAEFLVQIPAGHVLASAVSVSP